MHKDPRERRLEIAKSLATLGSIIFLAGLLLAVWGFMFGCARAKESSPASPDERLGELRAVYQQKLDDMLAVRDPATGWPDASDCDGMIWAAKYASATGVSGVDLLAAEYPKEPGRFSRRPLPCWTEADGDVGSKTTWSRDMATAGLIPWAFLTGNLAVLERHAAYGTKHGWVMGEPLADGRVIYTPAVIGLLYQAIYALGGELNDNAIWPNTYPSGLEDFALHLQVSDIWLRGRIDTQISDNSADAISQNMYERLEEATQKEPADPFFAFAKAEYTGDMEPAVSLLLDPTMPHGSYVRCADERTCVLANWIFSASLVIQALAN